MRSTLRALALVIAVGTLLTMADPDSRLTTARMVLFAVGSIAAIGLAYGAARRDPKAAGVRVPFETPPPPPRPAPLPRDLGRLMVELRSLDASLSAGPRAAERARIPTTVRTVGAAVVDDRLRRRGQTLAATLQPDPLEPDLRAALATGRPVSAATFVDLVEHA